MRRVIRMIEGWTVESTDFMHGRGSAWEEGRIKLRREVATAVVDLLAPRVHAGDPEQLAGVRLTEAAYDDEGTIELIFEDGTVIGCPPDEQLEAWQVSVDSLGALQLLLFAMPGGDVAGGRIHPPSEAARYSSTALAAPMRTSSASRSLTLVTSRMRPRKRPRSCVASHTCSIFGPIGSDDCGRSA